MYERVLKNVHLINEKQLLNIGIKDGKFAEITEQEIHGEIEWDAKGDCILPPFVETHTHLDTVLTAGNPRKNVSGTLFEAITIWQERKSKLTSADVMERATSALYKLMEHGVLFVRAAVDISDSDLTALKGLVAVKEKVADVIDLQIIAFPQDGLISCQENQERLIQAIELGADAVSAVPHLENTREAGIASLEYAFSVAQKYDKLVHIFCDELDDEHSRFLEVVAELTLRDNLAGKVTASHANALAYYSDAYAQKVIQLVKQAGVTIVSCPLINSTMQGRFDPFPKGRGITRIKQLNDAGVNVCIAHDDIRTPFYPLGNGNILQAAHLGLHLAHMTGDEDLNAIINMISHNGAKCFMMDDRYGIDVGNEASFITLPVNDVADLLSDQPKCSYVVRRGNLIATTKPQETVWYVGKEKVSQPYS